MSQTLRHALPLIRATRATLLIACAGTLLAACGGGGGDDTSAAAGAQSVPGESGAASASVAAAAATSTGTQDSVDAGNADADGTSASAGSVTDAATVASAAAVPTSPSATPTAPLAAIRIADAVATARALSASAMMSLALPATQAAAALPLLPKRVFHVDPINGADANDGRAAAASGPSGPWKTLARVARAALQPGDRVELACGGVWHETLRLPANGAVGTPIVVAAPAAGCSTPPRIDGTVSIAPSAWTAYKGHIYKAPVGAAPLQLLVDGGNFVPAHFPSGADAAAEPGSPWLALGADSNGTVLTTGRAFALPAGATIDTTTTVHVRTNAYVIDESPVASFDGSHFTLAKATTYPVRQGWGYFLTGQLWMLRGAGQWWYDAKAGQLYAWMPDSSAPSVAVAATTLPIGIDLNGRSHVVVDGIAVHGVGFGVDARSTTDVTLRNLLVEDVTDVGIDVAGSRQDVVDSNGVARTGSDAITGWGGAVGALLPDANALVARGNLIRDSGAMVTGDRVTSLPRRSLAALFTGTNATADGNVIIDVGYIGILAETNSVVTDNFFYGACSVQDDCGGIYTSGAYNRSRIAGNTVVHSRGQLFGQPVGQRATAAQGIYIDNLGSDIVVQGNTVIDADFGIQLHDGARDSLLSNRLFGNRRGQIWMQEDTAQMIAGGDTSGNVVSGNELAPVAPDAVGMMLTSTFASTSGFGVFSANRFFDRVAPVVVADSSATANAALPFAAWSGSTGMGSTQRVDVHGAATSGAGFAAYTVAGANLVPNGALQTDSSGWSSWNASAPAGRLTRATCAAGPCLQYAAGGSAGVLSSPGFALQEGAWYRLTIDTSAQTDHQVVPLVVRVGSGDYASISDRALAFTADRAWSRHAVVFQATRTIAGTGARVDIDGIVAGQSLAIAHLEIVPIAPDAAMLAAGVVVNAAGATSVATCPFTGAQAGLCGQSFDLATGQQVTWPVALAPHSAMIVYGQDPALVDSDGDGIPDSQDNCPGTPRGVAVDAAGCALATN